MNAHEELVRALCAQRGLELLRQGACWRIVGRGVDVRVTSLSLVAERDLDRVKNEHVLRRYLGTTESD